MEKKNMARAVWGTFEYTITVWKLQRKGDLLCGKNKKKKLGAVE